MQGQHDESYGGHGDGRREALRQAAEAQQQLLHGPGHLPTKYQISCDLFQFQPADSAHDGKERYCDVSRVKGIYRCSGGELFYSELPIIIQWSTPMVPPWILLKNKGGTLGVDHRIMLGSSLY